MKSTLNKEKIIEKYIKGYSIMEISKLVNANYDAVRKCLSRAKKKMDYREVETMERLHERNRFELKEVIRSETRLATQHMTTSNLVKFCRHSFNSTKNGGLKFNENRGAKPADLPKYFRKSL